MLVRVALKHNLTEHETGNVTLVSGQGKRLDVYGSYSWLITEFYDQPPSNTLKKYILNNYVNTTLYTRLISPINSFVKQIKMIITSIFILHETEQQLGVKVNWYNSINSFLIMFVKFTDKVCYNSIFYLQQQRTIRLLFSTRFHTIYPKTERVKLMMRASTLFHNIKNPPPPKKKKKNTP